MATFHERLKELREQSGKTQVQIAEELEVTPQNLSYYFNGREPSYDLLIKLAQMFNVSTDYLLGKSEFKNFDLEYDYKVRSGNEQILKTFSQDKKALLISINENFSEIINSLVENKENKHFIHALIALNQLFTMLNYIKTTLTESFIDMKDYIVFLKAIVTPDTTLTYSIFKSIEFNQTQINACRRCLYQFLNLYVCTIFDFEKMKVTKEE